MDGYFVAPDAHNTPTVWRENGDLPIPVLCSHDVGTGELWVAIVDLVEGEK